METLQQLFKDTAARLKWDQFDSFEHALQELVDTILPPTNFSDNPSNDAVEELQIAVARVEISSDSDDCVMPIHSTRKTPRARRISSSDEDGLPAVTVVAPKATSRGRRASSMYLAKGSLFASDDDDTKPSARVSPPASQHTQPSHGAHASAVPTRGGKGARKGKAAKRKDSFIVSDSASESESNDDARASGDDDTRARRASVDAEQSGSETASASDAADGASVSDAELESRSDADGGSDAGGDANGSDDNALHLAGRGPRRAERGGDSDGEEARAIDDEDVSPVRDRPARSRDLPPSAKLHIRPTAAPSTHNIKASKPSPVVELDSEPDRDDNAENTPRTPEGAVLNSEPAWWSAKPAETPRGGTAAPGRPVPHTAVDAALKSEMRRFARQRDELTARWYEDLNRRAFRSVLPVDLKVTWSKRMNTTAGFTYCKIAGGVRSAAIELSTKVLDTEKKMSQTLAHEMCHAAVFLINRSSEHHGKEFMAWGAIVTRAFPDITVKTCHNYDINYKYRFHCMTPGCGRVYQRHSKSIDTETNRCGACMGKLVLEPRLRADGTPAKKGPNPFASFVKENFAATKSMLPPGTPHSAVMRELGARFKSGLQMQPLPPPTLAEE